MKRHTYRGCESGKKRFSHKVQVQIALMDCQRKNRPESKYYRCPCCKGWHLTSRS